MVETPGGAQGLFGLRQHGLPGLRVDDVVRADRLVEFLGGGGHHRGADHRQAGDQREADHQRGGGGAGAARVAQGVALGEAAHGPEGPQHHTGEHPHHTRGEQRADHDEADEGEDDAQAQPHRSGSGLLGGRGEEEPRAADAGEDQAEDGTDDTGLLVAGGAGLAQGGHRGDLAGPAGRDERGDDGDDDTEEDADDRGGPGDGQIVRRQVHAHLPHELHESDGQAHARADAQHRAHDTEEECLDDHGLEDLAAVGADGAHQADLAGALGDQHREGVEDQEDADEEGDAGEAEHHVLHDVEEGADVLAVGVRGFLGRLQLVGVRTDRGRDVLLELVVAHPVLGGDVDVRERAGSAEQLLLRGGGVEIDHGRARVGHGEGGDTGDPGADVAGDGDGAQFVTELQTVLVHRVGVDHHLGGTARRVTRDDLHGLELVVAPVPRDGRGAGGRAQVLVLGVDHRDGHRDDAAFGALDALGLLDLLDDRAVEHLGLAALGDLLPALGCLRADRHVGAGDGEQLVEGGVHGVGEHQGAADERDGEQDRDGGERHPPLVRDEVAPRGLQDGVAHDVRPRASKSFIRSRTWSAEGPYISSTIRPSARKMTRSA